jgi:protein-tyrosine phosphatase
MIDVHSHILPAVDDGAKTIEESLAMGRIAARDGITDIVATPHALNGTYENPRGRVLEGVAALQEAFLKADIRIRLYPGADVRLTDHLVEHVKRGDALTLNDTGKYVFVELPSQVIPANMAEFIFELELAGMKPIITHPERNIFIEKNPNILYDLVEKGALAQITAASLTGMFGGGAQDTARKLLKCGLVHLIATDAHSPSRRPPVLSEGVKCAARIVGKAAADAMVNDTPRKILAGTYIETNEPQRYRPFFSFFTK